jgi:hypothetical protein
MRSLKLSQARRVYQDPRALTDYVQRLLTAAEEPSVTTPYQVVGRGEARQVAEAIARKATARDHAAIVSKRLLSATNLLLACSGRSGTQPCPIRARQQRGRCAIPGTFMVMITWP